MNLRLQGELGLSLVLFKSMTAMADAESCRVHELAAGLGVSAGGASKLADRHCALGYCQRLPNLEDRRSALLQLTPAGRRELAAAARSIDQELERLIRPVLSAAQIAELAATLRELRRAGLGPPAQRY